MSPYVPFIFNFVKSEGTLPLLDKMPLATSQPSDFFFPQAAGLSIDLVT